ncbi:MAG: site-specific integrase [Phycisphaerae bacterium]|nr:site-specific integrase [Phycisphaerae bacterium]
MAEKINFTQNAIEKLPLPKTGRTYYADAKTPGLVLAVWDSGVKAFELYKRIAGRPTRLKIGRYPQVTVEQARKEIARLSGQIAQGKNPAESRRKARAETTVGELFALYLNGHAKPHKRTWQGDQDQFDRYLVPWTARKLSQIRKADVAALHAKVGKDNGPYAANRLLAMLSAMFNYASGLGYESPNPAKGVKKFKEQSRDRFLRADEIQSFFAALGHEETPQIWQDFFALSLLTGARRSNVLAMKWADLELKRGLWKIPESESKNKEPLLCILPPQAVEILQRRHADQTEPGEYVFPSWGESGHVTEPKKAWKQILHRAKIKDLRIHDLRRTLGSWQAATGASLSIIGRSLGHKNVATTAVYARLDLDPVRASVNTAADAILAAANGMKTLPAPAKPGESPKKSKAKSPTPKKSRKKT